MAISQDAVLGRSAGDLTGLANVSNNASNTNAVLGQTHDNKAN